MLKEHDELMDDLRIRRGASIDRRWMAPIAISVFSLAFAAGTFAYLIFG